MTDKKKKNTGIKKTPPPFNYSTRTLYLECICWHLAIAKMVKQVLSKRSAI